LTAALNAKTVQMVALEWGERSKSELKLTELAQRGDAINADLKTQQ
jgi:hypothetical protein